MTSDRSSDAAAPTRQLKYKSLRYITLTYVLALALIAGLSLSTHLTVDRIVAQQQETAHVVNVSGRQRMLSQRIAELSLELSGTTDTPTRRSIESRLLDAVDLMGKSHAALTKGSAELGIKPTDSAAVTAIYLDEPYRLDQRVTQYIDWATAFLALAPEQQANSPDLGKLLEAAHEPILVSLDAAVRQYQRDSEAAIYRLRIILLGSVMLMLVTLFAEAMFIFRPLFRRLKRTQDELIQAAMVDPLTGCMNRRCLVDQAQRELDRARRYEFPVSMLMLDIDHFKEINDNHGHAAGDEAICTLVRRLLRSMRSSDILGRIGGEEFAIILPQTGLSKGKIAAEKLRAAVSAAPVRFGDVSFPMTVSIGVSEILPEDKDFFQVLGRADQALYEAKRRGRDRVVSWETIHLQPIAP
jgi:diguanylate cyclase (GGDEF)-like protein